MANTSITITPIQPGSEVNFGAICTGVDMNNLTDKDLEVLRTAIYEHNVLVVKDQQKLIPSKQFEFVCRLDPDATPTHGTGTPEQFKKTGGVISKRPVYHVPGAGGVRLVGAGYHGSDHYGLKDITIQPLSHVDMQASPLSAEQLAAGQARFQGWHFDGLLYGDNPSRVTALRCIKSPNGPDLTVRWDDGSGYTMKVKPGGTAFFSGYQLYDLLSSEERLLFDNSSWEAAPFPFLWTGDRKQRTTGIGFTDQGSVVAIEDLPEWEPEKVQRYPMVWLNPVTGKRAVQIHPTCVRKFYLKTSRHEEERVVEDFEEIKRSLNNLMDRIIHPDYILVPPSNEGDVVVWNNWGLMHTAIEYPESYGARIMHQCHIASSTAPIGPQEIA